MSELREPESHAGEGGRALDGSDTLALETDALVLGGGPAGTWAALAAAAKGARVALADKGYCGSSGATAPSGVGVWYVPPVPELREAAKASREGLGGFLADRGWMDRVLDRTWTSLPGGAPVIARQSDCQTCFMCEAYCPVDALYVAPEAERPVPVGEEQLSASGLLGSYRAAVGWGTRRKPGDPAQAGRRGRPDLPRPRGSAPRLTPAPHAPLLPRPRCFRPRDGNLPFLRYSLSR